MQFSAKATGWAYVATGAFFIALKETWELRQLYGWPLAVFWILVPVMIILSALQTTVRQKRNHEALDGSETPGEAGG